MEDRKGGDLVLSPAPPMFLGIRDNIDVAYFVHLANCYLTIKMC